MVDISGFTAVLGAVAVTEAGLRLRQARWADARRLASEAIALLEGLADDDTVKRALADALRYHDIAAGELEGDAAMTNLPRALELYDQAGDELSKSKILNVLGARAYFRGDWTTAAVLYDQARAAAESAGDVVGAAIESANAAEVLIDQGRVGEAAELVDHALRVFEASDNPYLVSFVTGFAGGIAQQEDDPDRARAAFRTAADGFAALDETEAALDARVRLIEATLDAGAVDEAAALVAELEGHSQGSRLLRQRARLAAIDGDTPAAIALTLDAADDPAATPLERALSLAQLFHLRPDPAVRAEGERVLAGLGAVNAEQIFTISPVAVAVAVAVNVAVAAAVEAEHAR